ncbi:YhdB family protein [Halolactibacillus alkaliphilus]|uniref:YhdB family protein n=2 Tax=Halolactibacillus alkaliphilus TaxID=442899 RepID=UPI001160CA51|nr:YhdB family protein [Halolactibacillus alkaliphilus]
MMNSYLLCATYLFDQNDDGLFMLMLRTDDDILSKRIHQFLTAKHCLAPLNERSQTEYFCLLIDYITHGYHQGLIHLSASQLQSLE